jgi:hypothetical protein
MAQFIKALEVVRGGYIRISPTDTQFDPNLLAPYCDNAERRYIRDVIGAAFFDELKANRTPNIINYNSTFGAIQPAFSDADLENLFLNGKLFDLIGYAVVEESLSFANPSYTPYVNAVENYLKIARWLLSNLSYFEFFCYFEFFSIIRKNLNNISKSLKQKQNKILANI